MQDRWIFGFRKTESRELSETEREELRRLARRASGLRFLWGFVCVVLGIASIGGIMVATSYAAAGWLMFIVALVGCFWVISWANSKERLSLLLRRAARVGRVDVYERSERSDEVWAKYRREMRLGEEETTTQPSVYWMADERFEENLRKLAGMQPDKIETPVDDDVVLSVGGKFVSQIIDVPVLYV